MVIYTYLPKELLPESFEDLTFEEFFELYGQADCAREMRIEDIETGVAKGIADNFSNDEYSGIVTVEKTIVRSDDTGAVHMYIYFAGGEKDV